MVIKIKDKFNGFILYRPEAVPSIDVPGVKNGYRQMSGAPTVDSVDRLQVMMEVEEDQIRVEYEKMIYYLRVM